MRKKLALNKKMKKLNAQKDKLCFLMHTAFGSAQSTYLRMSKPRNRTLIAAPKHCRAFREAHK